MKKEEKTPNLFLHPVDYFNLNFEFEKIFDGDKTAFAKSKNEICYPNPEDLQDDMNKPTYVYSESTGKVSVMKANPHRITCGEIISKFHIYSFVKFKGDIRAAESHILFQIMKLDVPYCRIGCDYFKMIPKKNRNGGIDTILRG